MKKISFGPAILSVTGALVLKSCEQADNAAQPPTPVPEPVVENKPDSSDERSGEARE